MAADSLASASIQRKPVLFDQYQASRQLRCSSIFYIPRSPKHVIFQARKVKFKVSFDYFPFY